MWCGVIPLTFLTNAVKEGRYSDESSLFQDLGYCLSFLTKKGGGRSAWDGMLCSFDVGGNRI